jgi:hypothetical protein
MARVGEVISEVMREVMREVRLFVLDLSRVLPDHFVQAVMECLAVPGLCISRRFPNRGIPLP